MPDVLIFSPIFSGSDHVLSANFVIIHKSRPPKPPARFDENIRVLPVASAAGCELYASSVMSGVIAELL